MRRSRGEIYLAVAVLLTLLVAAPAAVVGYLLLCIPLGARIPDKGPLPVVEISLEELERSRPGRVGYTICNLGVGEWICCVAAVDRRGRRSSWACDTTVVADVGPGISDPTSSTPFLYGPNPTEGELFFVSPGGVLEVYDLGGRRVLECELAEGSSEIYLEVPSGVYFFRLLGRDGSRECGKVTVVK